MNKKDVLDGLIDYCPVFHGSSSEKSGKIPLIITRERITEKAAWRRNTIQKTDLDGLALIPFLMLATVSSSSTLRLCEFEALFPMEHLLSPKQIAAAIGASESSLKRWCDQGLLTTVKTAGGHRRIPVQEVLRFVREQNHVVVEPRILSLPSSEQRNLRRVEGCAERLVDALLGDNEIACRAIVFELFLAGHSISEIFDEVIAIAFRTIGDKWVCNEIDVYQERCSCQIMLRVLHELRAKQVPPKPLFKACGVTIEGDQYSLPSTMVEIVLRSVGWDARLLGQSIPYDSMINSIERNHLDLFWVSVSYIHDEEEFVAGFNRVYDAASKSQTAVVIGGRGLTADIRGRLRYTAFCDTMQQLEELGKALCRQAKSAARMSRQRTKSAKDAHFN